MLLRDALIVAAVAVLTVQGLRRWYGDRYLVPSDSMQPVLYGDPIDGDVVFVYKLADASSCGPGAPCRSRSAWPWSPAPAPPPVDVVPGRQGP